MENAYHKRLVKKFLHEASTSHSYIISHPPLSQNNLYVKPTSSSQRLPQMCDLVATKETLACFDCLAWQTDDEVWEWRETMKADIQHMGLNGLVSGLFSPNCNMTRESLMRFDGTTKWEHNIGALAMLHADQNNISVFEVVQMFGPVSLLHRIRDDPFYEPMMVHKGGCGPQLLVRSRRRGPVERRACAAQRHYI